MSEEKAVIPDVKKLVEKIMKLCDQVDDGTGLRDEIESLLAKFKVEAERFKAVNDAYERAAQGVEKFNQIPVELEAYLPMIAAAIRKLKEGK